MKVIDLALILSRLDALEPAAGTTVQTIHKTPDNAYVLVTLAPGDRWPDEDEGASSTFGNTRDTTFLMLEGVATWITGDLRQSLGSGHLVVVDAVTPVEVLNDSERPIVFLMQGKGS